MNSLKCLSDLSPIGRHGGDGPRRAVRWGKVISRVTLVLEYQPTSSRHVVELAGLSTCSASLVSRDRFPLVVMVRDLGKTPSNSPAMKTSSTGQLSGTTFSMIGKTGRNCFRLPDPPYTRGQAATQAAPCHYFLACWRGSSEGSPHQSPGRPHAPTFEPRRAVRNRLARRLFPGASA